MMELAMAGFDPQVLDTREVKYQCDCSKGRTKDMLLSLGRKELVKPGTKTRSVRWSATSVTRSMSSTWTSFWPRQPRKRSNKNP